MSAEECLLAEFESAVSELKGSSTKEEREQIAKEILGRIKNKDTDVSFVKFVSFVPKWPELAKEALHGPAGEFVQVVTPHTEADPAALLLQFLVAFGNVVGRGPHFRVEADRHAMNLNAVLVGETSKSRKGTSWGHVKSVLEAIDPKWATERIQSGLSTGEGLIHAVRDPAFSESKEDSGVDDKRLLVVEGEFVRTLRAFKRDVNTLSPVMRNAWDGVPLRTLTKVSAAIATDAHISILGHITRPEVSRYLTDVEAGNGFGNRFLWVLVRRSRCLPEGGNLNESELIPIQDQVRKALQFSRTVTEISRDQESRLVWNEVYLRLSEGKPGLLGAMIARAEAQVTRLSCVYALLDRSGVVRRRHLQAALAVWDYCENSALFVFRDSLGNPIAETILEALKRAIDTGMSRTDISSLFGRNRRANEINQALNDLRNAGRACSEVAQTDGRSKEVWRITKDTKETKEALVGRAF